jgi:hypothetical protein
VRSLAVNPIKYSPTLSGLPNSSSGCSSQLATLIGPRGKCRSDVKRLACVLERTVETTAFAAGHEPKVFEYQILVGFLVEEENGVLRYSEGFDKTAQAMLPNKQ